MGCKINTSINNKEIISVGYHNSYQSSRIMNPNNDVSSININNNGSSSPNEAHRATVPYDNSANQPQIIKKSTLKVALIPNEENINNLNNFVKNDEKSKEIKEITNNNTIILSKSNENRSKFAVETTNVINERPQQHNTIHIVQTKTQELESFLESQIPLSESIKLLNNNNDSETVNMNNNNSSKDQIVLFNNNSPQIVLIPNNQCSLFESNSNERDSFKLKEKLLHNDTQHETIKSDSDHLSNIYLINNNNTNNNINNNDSNNHIDNNLLTENINQIFDKINEIRLNPFNLLPKILKDERINFEEIDNINNLSPILWTESPLQFIFQQSKTKINENLLSGPFKEILELKLCNNLSRLMKENLQCKIFAQKYVKDVQNTLQNIFEDEHKKIHLLSNDLVMMSLIPLSEILNSKSEEILFILLFKVNIEDQIYLKESKILNIYQIDGGRDILNEDNNKDDQNEIYLNLNDPLFDKIPYKDEIETGLYKTDGQKIDLTFLLKSGDLMKETLFI